MVEPNGPASAPSPLPVADHNIADQSSQPPPQPPDPNAPLTSTLDTGFSKRPRDARLLHMILANYGVSSYQERVPLQLMDFAYRYTASTLQDALHFTNEGYGVAGTGSGIGKGGAHNDLSGVTLTALRLSIASRTHYQFNPALPKQFYHEIAEEKNRVALPGVSREWGVRLPPEQYVMSGQGWDLKEEWDEVMEDVEEDGEGAVEVKDEERVGEDGGDEEEGGRMEDIFGEEDGDREMDDE
ncbi:Transcription initiation factor TFIID subunit 9 [Puttea exsequens]|nr:Transcription initiation factor TFIID subunit 9 [Puttea exsequens]